jgi:hypothetical protein
LARDRYPAKYVAARTATEALLSAPRGPRRAYSEKISSPRLADIKIERHGLFEQLREASPTRPGHGVRLNRGFDACKVFDFLETEGCDYVVATTGLAVGFA